MKKLKSKQDIPSWFPLKIYEHGLNIEQWHFELTMRLAVKTTFENTKDTVKANELFQASIIERGGSDKAHKNFFFEEDGSKYKSIGVDETKAFYFGLVAALMLRNKKGKQLIENINEAAEKYPYHLHMADTSTLEKLYKLPKEGDPSGEVINESRKLSALDFINQDDIDTYNEPLVKFTPTINLNLDDETLKHSFSLWLKILRQQIGDLKKPISEADIKKWIEFKILPAFDLVFWGKINGVVFTDNLIANTLWPYEEVDVVDRYRKVTKPKVDEFFKDFGLERTITSQIELDKFLSSFADTPEKVE